ncbi:MAG: YciI family protein [Candidatus Odinarchaeota archaeon]
MTSEKEIQHYFVITAPYRKDFITNPLEEENEIMNDHFQYLKGLLAQGKLFLAGPTLKLDDPFGVYIFETRDEAEARELIENDPSVKAGIQRITEFRPMRISLHR